MVIGDLCDRKDVEQFIDVHIVVFLQVHPIPIDKARHRKNVLVLVAHEITRLHCERLRKLVNLLDFLSVEIQLKNNLLFGENNCCVVLIRKRIFEKVLHANLIEDRHFLDNDSFVQHVFIRRLLIFIPFKNEQLILLLLVHDKVFAANDC